jgi:predicted HD superfamily hydrolase involved in NAD metabolism
MKATEETIMRYARKKLSGKRLEHVARVVEAIDDIAGANGIPSLDCRIAGWLHDSAKEEKRETFLGLVESGKIELDEETFQIPSLWHGFHAAYLGSSEFGIESEEILDAVRYHPTGAPGLGKIGLALFVADYSEPGRGIEGAGQIREQAKSDLLDAALRVVEEKIGYIENTKGKKPHSRSLAFRDWLQSGAVDR